MTPALQRLRQGVAALLAFARPLDHDLAAQHLSAPLLALFQRMGRAEQLHSLNVLREVLAEGDAPPVLAAAALLHDVGKSRYPLWVWQKTLAVLLRKFAPRVYAAWAAGDPANLFYRACVMREQHPAWGAEMVAGAGGEAALVWLVAHHQDTTPDDSTSPYSALLRRLQAADERH